jgi:AcrR family transcriptional regulator
MLDIAAAAGVAKGTLYNHFRTRDEVYRALAAAEAGRVLAEFSAAAASDGAAPALAAAARALATHPSLARLRAEEPAALASLLGADPDGATSREIRSGLSAVLGPAGPLARRWLSSWVLAPAGDPGPDAALIVAFAAGSADPAGEVLPAEGVAP